MGKFRRKKEVEDLVDEFSRVDRLDDDRESQYEPDFELQEDAIDDDLWMLE